MRLKILKQSVSIIILISISLSLGGPVLFYPREARAAIIGEDFTEKAKIALQTIWEGLKYGWRAATAAIAVWEQNENIIQWTEGQLLNLLIHQLLAQLTNDLVLWIQNGTEPRFVSEGLGAWITRGVDAAVGTFIDQYLGLGWLCDHLDMPIFNAFSAYYDGPALFPEEAECTLDDIVGNINNFYSDFSQGGWGAFVKASEPKNNLYGAYLIARAEKYEIIDEANAEQEQELAMGEGYLSFKDCQWFDATGQKVYFMDEEGEMTDTMKDVRGVVIPPPECDPIPGDPNHKTVGGYIHPCYEKCTLLTPASSIKELADAGITNFQKKINKLIGAAAKKAGPFQIYAQAILTALANRVMQEGVGLLRAGTDDDPTGSFTIPDEESSYADTGSDAIGDVQNSCPDIPGTACTAGWHCPAGTTCDGCCPDGCTKLGATCNRCDGRFQETCRGSTYCDECLEDGNSWETENCPEVPGLPCTEDVGDATCEMCCVETGTVPVPSDVAGDPNCRRLFGSRQEGCKCDGGGYGRRPGNPEGGFEPWPEQDDGTTVSPPTSPPPLDLPDGTNGLPAGYNGGCLIGVEGVPCIPCLLAPCPDDVQTVQCLPDKRGIPCVASAPNN